MDLKIQIVAVKGNAEEKIVVRKIDEFSYFDDLPSLDKDWHYRLEYYPKDKKG